MSLLNCCTRLRLGWLKKSHEIVLLNNLDRSLRGTLKLVFAPADATLLEVEESAAIPKRAVGKRAADEGITIYIDRGVYKLPIRDGDYSIRLL